MGGYGSTRWGWHDKRQTVEDCRRLQMGVFHAALLRGQRMGSVIWSRDGKRISDIGYRVSGEDLPEALHLKYTLTKHTTGEKKPLEYTVRLSHSPLPWGGVRLWFLCPARGCGRRVWALYLAPGGEIFACRHCYRLSYRSRQEGYQDRVFYRHMAGLMQDILPNMTWKEFKAVWDN